MCVCLRRASAGRARYLVGDRQNAALPACSENLRGAPGCGAPRPPPLQPSLRSAQPRSAAARTAQGLCGTRSAPALRSLCNSACTRDSTGLAWCQLKQGHNNGYQHSFRNIGNNTAPDAVLLQRVGGVLMHAIILFLHVAASVAVPWAKGRAPPAAKRLSAGSERESAGSPGAP